MKIGVLGPLTVDGDDPRLNPRERVVLEALVVAGAEPLDAERLADALWADAPPASWAKNLQNCVVGLRKALGHDAIETLGHAYRLSVPPEAVDLRHFGRLVARGHELLALGEPERAAYHLGQALDLWRGRPLTALDRWEPGVQEVRRLEPLRLDAQDWWLEARLASGGHGRVLVEAETMVEACPTRERRWQMLALAQYRAGRQADALETLRRARTTLVEELGLDPGPELAALERDVLRQDHALMVLPEPLAAGSESPYPGLAPFDVVDSENFFGREAAAVDALDRLHTVGVLVVVGPSGCGKSSFVRAGVAAAWERRGEHIAVLVPGAHPLAALADATGGSAGRRPALVVDQAEESFTLCLDQAERETFWSAVAEYADRAPVVVALRADRLGDVAGYPGLARMVERGLFLLGAMNVEELRAAVLEPAHRAGLVVEPGLVDLLLREVEGEPGALPLLSHALLETWRRREGRTLTVAAYQESGGVRGAIERTAEAVYADIDANLRSSMRNLMLRLVLPGPEGEPLRTRVPRSHVVTDVATTELVDVLVAARLLTSDADEVTLAHESLARSWPRLRGWLEDDAEGQRILHHVSGSADAWATLGRPESELYRGLRLTRTQEWVSRAKPELTDVEREFLAAATAHTERERLLAAERERTQLRLIRRQRLAMAVGGGLLVLAVLASGLAMWQQRVANQRGDRARTAEVAARAAALEALAGRAGARALSLDDVDTSLLLAASAARLHESSDTRGNLLDALARYPQLVGSVPLDGAEILGLEASPDGRSVAVYDHQSRVRLLDAVTGEVTADFTVAETPPTRELVAPLAFHPGDSLLAVGLPILSSRAVRFLDARTFAPQDLRLPGLTGPADDQHDRALSLAFSADGTRLAGTFHRIGLHAWPDEDPTFEALSAALLVWDLTHPESPRLLLRKGLKPRTFVQKDRDIVGLSPDGATAYTSRPLTAYSVETGRILWQSPHNGYVMDISPDGRSIAIDATPDVLVVDARTGEVRRRLRGHAEDIWALQWSDDGSLLASTADDATGIVWDPATGKVTEQMDLGETKARGLAFSPDGKTLFTGGEDRAVRRWDVSGRSAYVSRMVAPGEFGFGWVIPAHDGRTTAHMVVGQGTFFMDAATGGKSGPVGPARGFSDGSWTRDGDRFISVAGSHVQIWTPDGRLVAANRAHRLNGSGIDIDYTGDETRIVVTEDDGTVSLRDAETLEPAGHPVELGERVCCVSGGPGNSRALVLLSGPPTSVQDSFEINALPHSWAILDLERGAVVRRGQLEDMWFGAELSPDGSTAAIGTSDGGVVFVDTRTGKALQERARAHNGPCCSLSWSSDGRTVAGTGTDGVVSLWDGSTGALIGRTAIPEVSAASLEFLPDGHKVMIATYADGVYVWDTSVEAALDHACAVAARNLTPDEWETFFPGQPYQETCSPEPLGRRSTSAPTS